ncbi:MAG: hypothetical protein MUC97_11010 [Bernardetiaceae bacterium]|jgi:hypothetical protein|nr:hypothetical protein [Bernardetiaceae bacterium]
MKIDDDKINSTTPENRVILHWSGGAFGEMPQNHLKNKVYQIGPAWLTQHRLATGGKTRKSGVEFMRLMWAHRLPFGVSGAILSYFT